MGKLDTNQNALEFQDNAEEPQAGRRGSETHGNKAVQVRDWAFIERVRLASETQFFIYGRGMVVSPEDSQHLDLSELLEIQYNRRGRPVTRHEWQILDRAQQALAKYFTAEVQKQRRLSETRRIIAWLPLTLLITTVSGIVLGVSPQFAPLNPLFALLAGYLLWTLSLGGLGAAAFLAVNSLAVRNDATFDLSDRTLIWMRMAIGAVFAFVLSLAVSLESFMVFTKSFLNVENPGWSSKELQGTVPWLLLPFILGFSTSLVLMILDRFVIAVESFFGARFTTLNPVAAGAAAGAEAGAAAGATTGAQAGATTGAQAGATTGAQAGAATDDATKGREDQDGRTG